MRYNELTEREIPHTVSLDHEIASVSEFVALIKHDCSEILDVYRQTDTNNVLYRGINGLDSKINRIDYWEDRTPTDMPRKRQDMIDDVLLSYGMKAVRGNSIFTTSESHIAKDWGDMYIIFPMNGFQYTWFRKQLAPVRYMYFTFNEIIDDAQENYSILANDAEKNDMLEDLPDEDDFVKDQLFKATAKYEPTNTDLITAIKEGKEVLITGPNSYYAIDVNWARYMPQLLA